MQPAGELHEGEAGLQAVPARKQAPAAAAMGALPFGSGRQHSLHKGLGKHIGPVGLNEPAEACVCRDGVVMFVSHCSPGYCNRRQKCLLRISPKLFTGCCQIRAVPSWHLVKTSHPPSRTAFHDSNESSVGKIMEQAPITLHCSYICYMLLSMLSQNLSEGKKLDFELPAESDHSQQPSSGIRFLEGESVLLKPVSLADTLSFKRNDANMQRRCSNCDEKKISIQENLTWIRHKRG